MPTSNIFLDVDPSIVERNLKITKNPSEEDLFRIPELPYKLHKPSPGFCLKMRNTATNKKLFVNICQLDVLPEPADIKPEDVFNEELSFRVPMSIGDVRYEMDKKGEEATVVDIAVNTNFFNKITSNENMTSFIIELAKDSLKEKYKLSVADEVILLRNRKAFGELQMHRIRKQEIDEKMGTVPKKDPIITEISTQKSKPQIEVMADGVTRWTPAYRVFKKKQDPTTLFVEVNLPYCMCAKDFELYLNEDRMVLESKSRSYFLDVFFPCFIDVDDSKYYFVKAKKTLRAHLKVKNLN